MSKFGTETAPPTVHLYQIPGRGPEWGGFGEDWDKVSL